jgi:HAD superfamily hydrolase (TIGR01509 family)
VSKTVLLLDVMGTLVRDPFYDEALAFHGMSLDELYAVKSKACYLDFEHGRTPQRALRTDYFSDGRALDVQALGAVMEAAYAWLPGIEALLQDLHRAGVPMHALSNYSVWYERIEAQLRVSRWVSWWFVSCKTQHRKPAPEAYLGAARSLGVPPQQCVFVDDRAKNCAGATAVGMRSIHFVDAPTLREAIRDLDLLGR